MSFCAPVGLEMIHFNDTMECRPLCPCVKRANRGVGASTVEVSGKVDRAEEKEAA